MVELAVLAGAVVIGGTVVVLGLHLRAERSELDRIRAFQEAMRAGGRDNPLPHQRED